MRDLPYRSGRLSTSWDVPCSWTRKFSNNLIVDESLSSQIVERQASKNSHWKWWKPRHLRDWNSEFWRTIGFDERLHLLVDLRVDSLVDCRLYSVEPPHLWQKKTNEENKCRIPHVTSQNFKVLNPLDLRSQILRSRSSKDRWTRETSHLETGSKFEWRQSYWQLEGKKALYLLISLQWCTTVWMNQVDKSDDNGD